MNCLLCDQEIPSKLLVKDLLFLKPENQSVCTACFSSFDRISDQHCPTCYRSGWDKICSDCLEWQSKGVHISHHALFTYNASMKDYFSRYKFMGDYLLCQVFSKTLRQVLKSYKTYTIVPVPLGPERMAERGFNQVTGLLNAAGIAYQDILAKTDVEKQSSHNRQERLAADSPFYLRENQVLPDKILLVDDIYTTGATLQGICQLLYERGVKEIKTFSLSR